MKAIVIQEKTRKCGRQKQGGIYLKSGTDGSPEGCLPKFVLIQPPVPNPGKFYRGTTLVDGQAILARRPYEEWLAGTSKERLEKEKGDAWAIETFGMTSYERLHTGSCASLDSLDDAMQYLSNNVMWDDRITKEIQTMTKMRVPDLPRAVEHFATLVRCCQDYIATRRWRNLIAMVAATWRLADTIPSKNRQEIIPLLMRILTLLGLRRDALAMQNKYFNFEEE